MSTPRDDETFREEILQRIQRQLDGELTPEEENSLAEILAERPELTAERRAMAVLYDALDADRVAVDPGLEDRILAALPAVPPWAAPARSRWAFATVAALFLAVTASLFLLTGAGSTSPMGGVIAALADFLVTTSLAGAGLLAASWQGLGMALGELLDGPGWIVFGAGVLALDLLLVQLLRRRRLAASERSARGDD
jgi:anti-sigma factor RsiW